MSRIIFHFYKAEELILCFREPRLFSPLNSVDQMYFRKLLFAQQKHSIVHKFHMFYSREADNTVNQLERNQREKVAPKKKNLKKEEER